MSGSVAPPFTEYLDPLLLPGHSPNVWIRGSSLRRNVWIRGSSLRRMSGSVAPPFAEMSGSVAPPFAECLDPLLLPCLMSGSVAPPCPDILIHCYSLSEFLAQWLLPSPNVWIRGSSLRRISGSAPPSWPFAECLDPWLLPSPKCLDPWPLPSPNVWIRSSSLA